MIDSDTIVKCQDNEKKIRLLLVTKNSKRIEFLKKKFFFGRNKITKINMEKMIEVYGEEEMVRMMKVITENNITMLKLQKQIVELQVAEEEKKKKQRSKQEEREQEKREYEERWEEKEQRRQKEKEKVKERKRIDEKRRKIEEIRI